MTYVQFESGDSIKADPLNTMQQMIEEDIQKQIEAAKQELRCPKRYFLDLEVTLQGGMLQPAVLCHNLGCNPIVQVYELQDLPIEYPKASNIKGPHQFCVCAPAEFHDAEAIKFETRSFDERHWGDDLDTVIKKIATDDRRQKKFKDSYTLSAWIRNLKQLLFEGGPAQYHFNMGDVYETKWVLDREEKPVEELKKLGEWPPRFVYRPQLVNNLIVKPSLAPNGGESSASKKGVALAAEWTWVRIGIFHLNLNEVEIAPETGTPTHLMVLLGS